MTSPAELLDEMLAALTPEVAAALRTTIPIHVRDQLDAASAETSQAVEQLGARLGAEPVGLPAWAALPAWLRLSITDTMASFAAGTASTCMHAPHLGRAEPLHAAVWRPGLIACSRCSHLFEVHGPPSHTCDACGRVCPATHEDGVRLVALAVGPVLFVTGCCSDCVPLAVGLRDEEATGQHDPAPARRRQRRRSPRRRPR